MIFSKECKCKQRARYIHHWHNPLDKWIVVHIFSGNVVASFIKKLPSVWIDYHRFFYSLSHWKPEAATNWRTWSTLHLPHANNVMISAWLSPLLLLQMITFECPPGIFGCDFVCSKYVKFSSTQIFSSLIPCLCLLVITFIANNICRKISAASASAMAVLICMPTSYSRYLSYIVAASPAEHTLCIRGRN